MITKNSTTARREHVGFEYSQITDHVYLGPRPCCPAHFAANMKANGIAAAISLNDTREEVAFKLDYFLWLPVDALTPPSEKQLLIGSKAISDLVENDTRVYVYCKRGQGRSPTLVSAYLVLTGIGVSAAIKQVRERRSIHLRRSQIKALSRFQQTVRVRAIEHWLYQD